MPNLPSKRTLAKRALRDARRQSPEAVTQLISRRERSIIELSAKECGMIFANSAGKDEPWRGYYTTPDKVAQPYSERMDVPTFATRMKLAQGEAQRINAGQI